MNSPNQITVARLAAACIALASLASCATTPPSCPSPQTRNLDTAIQYVETSLVTGCAAHFELGPIRFSVSQGFERKDSLTPIASKRNGKSIYPENAIGRIAYGMSSCFSHGLRCNEPSTRLSAASLNSVA